MPSAGPNVLILRTAGTNCDQETAYAFELVGGRAQTIHLGRVLENPSVLNQFQILAIPGGFSYGDDISSGKIFASQLKARLAEPLARFVESKKPVIGICNGFQVLIKTDLLPGRMGDNKTSSVTAQPATLAHNEGGRFIDRWVHLKCVSRKCIWTKSLIGSGNPFELPIAHGEGKFVPASSAVVKQLHENEQIALVYCRPDGSDAYGQEPFNPNGSIKDIAGICDASGLVLGLMPHPERHVNRFQHPAWTKNNVESGEVIGRAVFRSAVEFAGL